MDAAVIGIISAFAVCALGLLAAALWAIVGLVRTSISDLPMSISDLRTAIADLVGRVDRLDGRLDRIEARLSRLEAREPA